MNDVLIRELMNGMWFVLSLEIFIALLIYIVRQALKKEEPAAFQVTEPWYRQLGTQLAISWSTYIAGSAVRAGWIWALLECQGRLGIGNCSHVTETVEILFIACTLAIVGGVCTIRIMLPQPWRPWTYVLPAAFALAVPIAVHFVR